MRGSWFPLLLGCLTASAQITVPGEAQRGKEVFTSQHCVTCHSVNGEGGRSAPDLGRITGRDYTPFALTALMWNHAPVMWADMEKRGIAKPQLTDEQAADLFAYFWSARYFDKRGDAGRGKQVFESKGCAGCHGMTAAAREGAKPVSEWRSVNNTIELAAGMWNHSWEMSAAIGRKQLQRPQLTSQDMTDLLVYLQNLPETRNLPAEFSPGSAQTGETLFQAKGCAGCHQGKLTLEGRGTAHSMTDLAAAMWNHAPQMAKKPQSLSYEEMRRLVGYLWSIQFFDRRGNPDRGKQVFARKNCVTCHGNPSSGAPNLAAMTGKVNPFVMVDVLWLHGPAMLDRMRQNHIAWPSFTGRDMADLAAYLNRGAASVQHDGADGTSAISKK
jgi:mono/diheme cytochrome c family protein